MQEIAYYDKTNLKFFLNLNIYHAMLNGLILTLIVSINVVSLFKNFGRSKIR